MLIDIALYEKIKTIMGDYDFYQINNSEEKVLITNETMIEILEDLLCEIGALEEKIKK